MHARFPVTVRVPAGKPDHSEAKHLSSGHTPKSVVILTNISQYFNTILEITHNLKRKIKF